LDERRWAALRAAYRTYRVPPSNHFEKLVGNLNGFHSVRVNKKWRLVFKWDPKEGRADDLYLDNHDYK
jgi:toxin HigB-1